MSRSRSSSLRQRGQIIVIFAGSMLALVALCAVVVDVAWYWTGNLRMQRAADAAALAGVVWLPGDPTTAYTTARAEAVKNGYTDGSGGVVVTPVQDPTNARRLKVSITGPVGTFFARVIGINSFPAKRDAKADYVLPVPMGSPENYYGVFGTIRGATYTAPGPPVVNTTYADTNSGWVVATATPAPSPAVWVASAGTLITAVNADDAAYARTATNNSTQQWSTFSFIPALGSSQSVTAINGIEVELTDAYLSAACAGSTNRISVNLSWDNGNNWTTTTNQTANLPTSTTTGDYSFGSASSLAAWAGRTWLPGDVSDANFRVRLDGAQGLRDRGHPDPA